MNYPVWELYYLNSGSLIALIAVTHVFVSHFAVGGGIFFWLTDLKSVRENDTELRQFIKKHLWFFLLLTMVFGGVSGVGIWFVIALSSPWATSVLIHNFVFAWAIEWVFFIGEIVSLLLYYYKFDVLSEKNRLRISFIYAASAWLSLFIINGIITLMLTPGDWLETQNFWDGFFNPTNLPGLVFRTAITLMFAGSFGFLTAVFYQDSSFRERLLRYCAKWLYIPLPFIVLSGAWYFYSIPENARLTNFLLNKQMTNAVNVFILSSIMLYIGSLFFVFKIPQRLQKIAAFLILLVGLFWIGGFEYMREYARKPYIIYGYMYSPSILVKDEEKLNREGFLKNAKWTKIKEITQENRVEAGKELFNLQCLSCHSVGGIKNDIVEKTKHLTYFGVISQLYGQGKIFDYMPKFIGTKEELEALAYYIVKAFHKNKPVMPFFEYNIQQRKELPFEFDLKKDEYVLLAWNSIGMKCVSDADRWFSFLYPANTIEAVLIKRGLKPELISKNIEINYKVEPGHENPSKHVELWKYSEQYFGKTLRQNQGPKGKGLSGFFEFNQERGVFTAESIPVVPYRDDGRFNPYPLFYVEAVDTKTGKVLQKTKVVAPVSTEMKCWYCHGGQWRWNNVSGISDETAKNILKTHDKNSKTNLYELALKGKPVLCQSCHEDFIVNAKGKNGHNSFSAAMHGFHANYIPFKDERACALCHPDHPKGNTRCMRDIHAKLGLKCVDCHGNLDEHATSLVLAQQSTTASLLLKNLKPKTPFYAINPRKPWINEPDCLNCHIGFQKPNKGFNAFNIWTYDAKAVFRLRKDNTGKLPCIACHSSPHAIYPAFNDYGKNIDNLQPVQYQGMPLPIGANFKCEVCHKKKMSASVHHANMLRKFRNDRLLKQLQ